jgi:radical SAM superfamily enzyme YgiQ (UPF0313 family)
MFTLPECSIRMINRGMHISRNFEGETASKKMNGGYKVVLTADRTLMSEYNRLIFLGFSACVPKGLIPDSLYFSTFAPSVGVNKDGSAELAPCGIRKVEAVLLDNGFSREDVIVAHPEHLRQVMGPNTKVLAINETDPLGIAPATSTFTQLLTGEAYMAVKFREILNHPSVKMYKPKIVVGGPGAWQLEDSQVRKKLGIDCVVIGEGERVIDTLFKKAIAGDTLPEIVNGEVVAEDNIALIREPTIDGIVEIARGCGRGCAFCIPTLQQYRCLSIDHILKEVEVNLRAGRRPLLHAEDVLRYKAKGLTVNKEAVIDLFKQVRNYPGVDSVAISHFALSSVASAPEVVEEITRILNVDGKHGNWFSGQTGVETGSPKLINDHMIGKCKPFKPDDWPQVVVDAFQILSDNFWVPVGTLIIGLPGETENDLELTMQMVKNLRSFKSLLVPLFFVSEGGLKAKSKSFSMETMTTKQTQLFLKCWEHNLEWADTFLREYFLNQNPIKSFWLRRIFGYGVGKSKELLHKCEKEYNYNLPAMVKDAREGRLKWAPFPIQQIYELVR